MLNYFGIEFQVVNVSLPQRPDWYLEFGGGTVPVIEFPDGFRIGESFPIMELIDEKYHEKSLYPSDPYGRANIRALISVNSSHEF